MDFKDGDEVHLVDGKPHRNGDLPAIVWSDGCQEWWVDGKCHRDNGLPAVTWTTGDQEWWVDGELHRDGGLPAVIHCGTDDATVKCISMGYKHPDVLLLRDGVGAYLYHGNRYLGWWFEGHKITQAQSEWIARIQAREDARRKWFILERIAKFCCDPKRAFVRRRLEREICEFRDKCAVAHAN